MSPLSVERQGLWLPGGKEHLREQLRELKKVMRIHAEFSGQEMNLGKKISSDEGHSDQLHAPHRIGYGQTT